MRAADIMHGEAGHRIIARLVLSAVVGAAGCGIWRPDGGVEFDPAAAGEQLLRDVMDAPTSFLVPAADDFYAWERALYFIGRYTSGIEIRSGKGPDAPVSLTNKAAGGDRYSYQVTKSAGASGMAYIVECRPRAPGAAPAMAERNARNLARFIRDGTIELSLLDR